MPDAFFASAKPRKRKRSDAGPSTKKFARKDTARSETGASRQKNSTPTATKTPKKRLADEELDSDRTDDDGGDIDDLDLTADVDVDPGASGSEDEDETPAEKRLRLAKLYLESVKEGLGAFFSPWQFFRGAYVELCVASGGRVRCSGDRQGAHFCAAEARCDGALGEDASLHCRYRMFRP